MMTMATAHTTIVCAALIARPDGRILISQRPPNRRMSGFWEFPGGKVELGEDPRGALVRECREELGCLVEVGSIYESVFHRSGNHCILLLFYLARVLEGEPQSMENNELAWVTPAEMENYKLLEADQPLVLMFGRRFPEFEFGAEAQ